MDDKKGFHIPIPVGLASVWFATHAGPGAAAGKLSAVYFSSYGRWGLVTPIITMLIMAICIYVGIEYSRIKKITNFNEFTNSFFHPYGKLFSMFFDLTYLAGVLVALAAGIATASGVINQYFHIPYEIAAISIVGISILLSIFSGELVRSASTVMTILIVVSLASIVVTGLAAPTANFSNNWQATSFTDVSLVDAVMKTFIYAGFLTTGCVANSIAVSDGLKSRKQSKQSAALGFLMNLFLAASISFLLFAYPQFINTDIPNYYIVEVLGYPILLFAYVLMVVLAVLSTAVSYAFSTAARYSNYLPMKAGAKRDFITVSLLFLASFLLSLVGLDLIIGKGYKYLGYAAIPTVILPLILTGRKKINQASQEALDQE